VKTTATTTTAAAAAAAATTTTTTTTTTTILEKLAYVNLLFLIRKACPSQRRRFCGRPAPMATLRLRGSWRMIRLLMSIGEILRLEEPRFTVWTDQYREVFDEKSKGGCRKAAEGRSNSLLHRM